MVIGGAQNLDEVNMGIMNKLPQLIRYNTGEEFDLIHEVISLIGAGIKVKEIAELSGDYYSIIYTGKLSNPKNKKLVQKIRQEEKVMEWFC